METFIVGLLFFIGVAIAAWKTIKSLRNNSCPGCSGGCSVEKRKNCKH